MRVSIGMGLVLGVASIAAWGQAAPGSEVGTVPPKDAVSVEALWPGAAPGAKGTTYDDVPKLYCYPAAGDGPHAAVVVLPGGGYNHVVMEKEGAVEARWLNAHGVSAYVLQYRLSPKYMYPWAMVDGLRAVRFVRAHAQEWKVRPDAIGVWGFSAGGHLAGYLATAAPHGEPPSSEGVQNESLPQDAIDKVSAHPDFAILSYARLTIDKEIPGTFGMESITGANASPEFNELISPVKHVTKDTSPSFIYATERDEKVNSLNATAFFDALQRAGVPVELHVFEQGPHGTGMGQNLPKSPELAIWPLLLEHWLQIRGVVETKE
jgi:acetyl esterase/lipase